LDLPLSAAKISSPLSSYLLTRNPRYMNQGKFIKLSEFLEIGKDEGLFGVMIVIKVIHLLEALFLYDPIG
jgi:hypothetical protein